MKKKKMVAIKKKKRRSVNRTRFWRTKIVAEFIKKIRFLIKKWFGHKETCFMGKVITSIKIAEKSKEKHNENGRQEKTILRKSVGQQEQQEKCQILLLLIIWFLNIFTLISLITKNIKNILRKRFKRIKKQGWKIRKRNVWIKKLET